eukprot:CAMPEP_0183309276 /NCGR_PEP_ID=MMETSP0160_2-20130417/24778_1 /TAXON_ID=2839 ORGANISM="Odontella Sinensis, Strain Grunow 1884" /NCGR_SAMPLE_ID=MMETSP0160_2 /ASSEMBLY_ACC=CAM_ASM_000250 /LENGTH=241 /DNA_ID=CAMNT_0025473279 /DNA_START=63 /DNA_END=788 /DNA_ORIENTATION=-
MIKRPAGRSASAALAALLLNPLLLPSAAFSPIPFLQGTHVHHPPVLVRQTQVVGPSARLAASCSEDGQSDGGEPSSPTKEREAEESPFPCLPPIGASSFNHSSAIAAASAPESTSTGGGSFVTDGAGKAAFVGEKFELQYTCKICETRNSNRVSRLAYREGVVIVVCKGCQAKHLIADNLGWHNYIGGFEDNMNIEEYLGSAGREGEVSRVSPNVFELEKALKLQSPPRPGVSKKGESELE